MPAFNAFFIVKPPPERKAKAKPSRSGLSKSERTAVTAFLRADKVERKRILHNQVDTEHQDKLAARRAWRRSYQRQYRAMVALATVIL
jgi:hypothetical protein